MKLYHLIYLSIATAEMLEAQLLELLETSRQNNTRDEITGMLLYKDGRFMQLLEGPESKVCATYGRIVRDLRHRDVTILLEGPIEDRDFADWSMGFRTLDDATVHDTPGYSDFLEARFSVFDFASDPSRAHQLLRVFRRM